VFPNRMGRDAGARDVCLHNAAQRGAVVLERWDAQCALMCKRVRVLALALALRPNNAPLRCTTPNPLRCLEGAIRFAQCFALFWSRTALDQNFVKRDFSPEKK